MVKGGMVVKGDGGNIWKGIKKKSKKNVSATTTGVKGKDEETQPAQGG